eukprot:scaffold48013_cov78-Cyclotella_meneghiniana.AAC.8
MANFVRAAVITSCLLVPTTLSQYNIESPSITQCLASPCEYIGECRSDSNECGEGSNYCNELSIWVPACGGGGTLQKEPTFTAAAPTITLDEDNMDANAQIDFGSSSDTDNKDEPTPSPITAWEAWTSGKTDGSNNQGGVIGYTTGKEGEEDWDPAEQSQDNGWFDKQGWESGNRTNDEDESIFSKINPFGRDDENSARFTNRVVVWKFAMTACLMVSTVTVML